MVTKIPWDSVCVLAEPTVSVSIHGYPWVSVVSVGIRGIRGIREYPWYPWDSVDSGDSGNLRVGLRGTPPDCRNIRKIHCFCDLAMDGAGHAQQIAQWHTHMTSLVVVLQEMRARALLHTSPPQPRSPGLQQRRGVQLRGAETAEEWLLL